MEVPTSSESYLSGGMLDAQFDFNLYDKLVGAIAFEEEFLDRPGRHQRSQPRHVRCAPLMGNITGNQDRPLHFAADGTLDVNEDMKFQGWTRDIQHGGDDGYAKMRLLMSYLSVPAFLVCTTAMKLPMSAATTQTTPDDAV